MAEKPEDPFESHDYPEYQKEENLPTRQEWMHNRLYNEPYKNYVTRQKLIESNRVGVKLSYLDGRYTKVKQLKKNILKEILDIPPDREIDETRFNLKLKPIDNDRYEMYYKNMIIGEYNTNTKSITILSEYNLGLFKVKYSNEIQKRYVKEDIKEDVKTDISVRKDLSTLKLEVDVEKAKEYERNLDRFKTRISELENEKREKDRDIRNLRDQLARERNRGGNNQSQIVRDLEQQLSQNLEDMANKDQRIGNLIDQYNKFREEKSSEIENLEADLSLKSFQIIEAQDQISSITKYASDLEDELKEDKETNEKVVKELKETNERLNDEKNRFQKLLDEYKKDKENLERRLDQNIDSRYQDVKTLIEERDKAIKERDSSISFQESLKTNINSLKNSVDTLETHNASLKLISEDQKIKLEEAKNEITEKEKLLQKVLDSKKEEIDLSKKR